MSAPERPAPVPLTGPQADLLREPLAAGPMPFADFMQTALYHPELGYYAQPGFTTGRQGDFATAPDAGALFGATLASAVERFAEVPGRLVEVGPGSGRLFSDILDNLSPEALGNLELVLVEPFPVHRERLAGLAEQAGPDVEVEIVARLAEVAPARSLVLLNEIFDALPVHPVRRSEEGWDALHVELAGEGLARSWQPASEAVTTFCHAHAAGLPEGQRYEANLGARELLEDLSGVLDPGAAVVFDYGDTFEQTWRSRPEGTLRGFRQHRQVDPLSVPGRTDITSDVDFTMLQAEAGERGLTTAAYGGQERLLVHLGMVEVARSRGELGKVKDFLVPGGFAARFRALVLSRGGGASQAGLKVDLEDPQLWMRGARGMTEG